MNDCSGPLKGRAFFFVRRSPDGTADVVLTPDGWPEMVGGRYCALIVRGVTPTEGLEESVRAHYEDWLRIAEVAEL